MVKPLFSFISVCYNHSDYLFDSLNSIINQAGNHDFELIIIDDFSTDGSRELLKEWVANNKNINAKLILNEQNIGLCKTLNKSITTANGIWIKPLSCDDILESDYLNNIAECIESKVDISLVCTDMSHINSKGEIYRNSNWEYGHVQVNEKSINEFENLLKGQYLNAPTIIFKKEIWNQLGGFDESLIFEDWDFYLRAKKIANFGLIKKSLVKYRLHEKNMHKNFNTNPNYVLDSIAVVKKHKGYSKRGDEIIREKILDNIGELVLIDENLGIEVLEKEINELKISDTNLPLVSVLMPAYNSEKYIINAVKSVLLQSYPNIELVIVNDGSVDKTGLLLSQLQSQFSNIKVLNQENQGVTRSLNNGLSYCTGYYVARMDSDDLIVPIRLEKQVNFLENNPDFLAVSSWMVEFGNNDYKTKRYKKSTEVLKSILVFDNPIPHAPAMFRANILKEIKYKDFKYAEDYNLWKQILFLGKVEILPLKFYYYRQHNTNVTLEVDNDAYKVRKDILEKLDINFIESELVLHEKYKSLTSERISKKDLILLNEWYKKLLKANSIKRLLPTKEFEEEVEKRLKHWYYINKDNHGIILFFSLFKMPYNKKHRFQLLKDSAKGMLGINK